MHKIEARWGKERGYHFYQTSDTAVKMIIERMTQEKIGNQLENLPFCGDEESVYIEELIPRAKEGFALSLKSDASNLAQDRDLLKFTMPLTVENIWSQIALTDKQNTLYEFGHVLTTLVVLAQSRRISFFQFPDPPTNIDYTLGVMETYWDNAVDSFENIWVRMEEMETLTRRALYSPQPMRTIDMLSLAHFFMSSKTVSQIFNNL